MRRSFLFAVLSLIALSSSAQLLWKVSGNGLEKPTFVFGTMHSASPSMIEQVTGLTEALEQCDVLIVEVNEPDESGTPIAFFAPRDSTIDKLLSPEQFNVVKAAVVNYYADADLDQICQLTPVFLRAAMEHDFIKEVFPDVKMGDGIDQGLQARAAAKGKPVEAFETSQDQYNFFAQASVSLKQQALDLYEDCTDVNYFQKFHDQCIAECRSYLNQELNTTITTNEDSSEDGKEILVSGRNRNWVEQLVKKMPRQSCLVVVGRAHLRGDDGLLQLLRDRGYTVEPMQ